MQFTPIVTKVLFDEQIEWLKDRFISLCPKEEIWNELETRYTEPSRAYHNFSHLYSIFHVLDEAGFSTSNPVLEYAIWYHDIIYNSKKKDNEKQSAIVFKKSCHFFLELDIIQEVETVILSTEKHYPLSEKQEVKWMLDLDLFILCSPRETYQKYAEAVREEYKWVPKILYKRGRKKVLQSFLKRDRIYFSDYFYEYYESIARENLKNELNKL
ncbi:MAG: putative metal-dependent HD superfamily phosphohydrolase [Maribacter sp.]|jgi:predicted metal-dependent HD superfamily phosphohydrolase